MESKSTDELEKILGSTHINEVSAYLKSNEESIISNEYAFHEYISKLIKLKNLRKQDVFLAADVSEKYGYKLVVVPKCTVHGEKAGSTLIRKYLQEGNLEAANDFLNEPYSIISKVVHGNAIGRSLIGLPTANQFPDPHKLLPPKGVYVTRIIYKNNEYYGITNIGTKPTVEDYEITGVETFIFDFDQNIYGEVIEVQFLHYKRPEMKFSGLEELSRQMKADAAYGRQYVSVHYGYHSK